MSELEHIYIRTSEMVKNKTSYIILIKCPLITCVTVFASVAVYQEQKDWSVFDDYLYSVYSDTASLRVSYKHFWDGAR